MGKRFPGRLKLKVLDAPTWANERWIGPILNADFIETKPMFNRPGLYKLRRNRLTLLEYQHGDNIKAYFIPDEHWDTEVECLDFYDMKLNHSKTLELMELASRLPKNISVPLMKLYKDELLKYNIKIGRAKNLKMLKDIKEKFMKTRR